MDFNFAKSLSWLFEHEGGLTNLKNDRGGLTNYGVTHEEYDRYRRFRREPLRSVSLITKEEAEDIFHTYYWDILQCHSMPSGVDDVVFDMAVNNGVVGAAKCAQIVAGKLTGKPITIDGHIGAISIDLIDDCDPAAFINAFCDQRLKTDAGFFNWKTFGKAWTNRVNGNKSLGITGVRTQGLSLIANDNRLVDAAKPKMPETVLCVQAAPAQSWVDWLISLIANLFRRH